MSEHRRESEKQCIGQHAEQSIKQHMERNAEQNIRQNTGRNAEQGIRQNTGRNAGQGIRQNTGQHAEQNIRQNMEQNMAQERAVRVHMTTIQRIDGEVQTLSHEAEGRFVETAAGWQLRYVLVQEDGETEHIMEYRGEAEMGDASPGAKRYSAAEASPAPPAACGCTGELRVRMQGASEAELVYREGHRHSAAYRTAYGAMSLDFLTESLKLQAALDGSGRLELRYSMHAGAEKLADCLLALRYEPCRLES